MRTSLKSDSQPSVDAEHATFLERWVVGTYIVAGVFPTDDKHLTVQQVIERIPSLYTTARSQKRAKWPRGLCGYFLIPVYVADSFDGSVIEWVHSHHPYRWAIWHEPVLYSSRDNSAHMRVYSDPRSDRYYWHGAAFRPYLMSVIGAALRAISHRFGHEFAERVNGRDVRRVEV